jgi:hypothetical protein
MPFQHSPSRSAWAGGRSRGSALRLAPATLCLILAGLVAAGCSLGPVGEQSGGVSLTVTSDFGARQLVHTQAESVPKGETVMRYLQRDASDVETQYGGKFVNGIDGLSGTSDSDWFYYVNGIEADVGAAEYELSPGDRVWWDYHDWQTVMRVPAVVGSFPEPFVHGERGKRYPVRIDCAADADAACERLQRQLDDAGITASRAALGSATGKEVLRFVVGTWSELRRDSAAEQLEGGPKASGVFAKPMKVGSGYSFQLLDPRGSVVRSLGAGAGLVAATRFEDQAPTWEVTGTDRTGLDRAVALVRASILRNRFAVASDGRPIPLPAGERPR